MVSTAQHTYLDVELATSNLVGAESFLDRTESILRSHSRRPAMTKETHHGVLSEGMRPKRFPGQPAPWADKTALLAYFICGPRYRK
jgi:hypothetical protein